MVHHEKYVVVHLREIGIGGVSKKSHWAPENFWEQKYYNLDRQLCWQLSKKGNLVIFSAFLPRAVLLAAFEWETRPSQSFILLANLKGLQCILFIPFSLITLMSRMSKDWMNSYDSHIKLTKIWIGPKVTLYLAQFIEWFELFYNWELLAMTWNGNMAGLISGSGAVFTMCRNAMLW